jgi:hypothetical protein
MAALTRSGVRKASEIVMLIFGALQFSRLAVLSALAVGSAISSSSQRRPGRAKPPLSKDQIGGVPRCATRDGNDATGPLYLEHAKFEGFEVRQTVTRKAAVQ